MAGERNTGILGGTFDPIHVGHLILAEEARTKLSLREIIFVPAGRPWLKPDREITAVSHRVEMVRQAIASNPSFDICTLEVERSAPSYSVDTLRMLGDKMGSEVDFFFILGQDALTDLPLWKEPERKKWWSWRRVSRFHAIQNPGDYTLIALR